MENEVTKKKCRACLEEKELCEFQKCKKYEDGYFYKCKYCAKNKVLIPKTINKEGILKKCYCCLVLKDTSEFYKNHNKCKNCNSQGEPINRAEILKDRLTLLFNGEYELVGEYGKRVNILHKTCGNTRDTNLSNALRRGCNYCNLKNKSRLCSKVEKYLIENSICYRTEIRFDTCKDKSYLPFDYGIYDCEGKLLFLIEVDGEQHFKETGFSRGELKEIQKRDNIKTNFCKLNKIVLYRIPYYDEIDIFDILLHMLKDVSRCCKKEHNGFISKSVVTEEIAEQIRTEYLKTSATIKSVSDLVEISTSTVSKVLKYIYFPNVLEELKKEIDIKYLRGMSNTSHFFKLSQKDIDKMISLKKEGISDTKIAKEFNIYRRTIKNFILDWEDLSPKKGVAKAVRHIETKLEFMSLKLACDYFNYIYANESANLRSNSKIKKFNYL